MSPKLPRQPLRPFRDPGGHAPGVVEVRATVGATADGRVVPAEADGGPERFGEGLLRGETRGKGAHEPGGLGLDKETFTQCRGALEGALEPGDVDDVDAHPDDHRWPTTRP